MNQSELDASIQRIKEHLWPLGVDVEVVRSGQWGYPRNYSFLVEMTSGASKIHLMIRNNITNESMKILDETATSLLNAVRCGLLSPRPSDEEEESAPRWLRRAKWGISGLDGVTNADRQRAVEVLSSVEMDDLPLPVVRRVGTSIVVNFREDTVAECEVWSNEDGSVTAAPWDIRNSTWAILRTDGTVQRHRMKNGKEIDIDLLAGPPRCATQVVRTALDWFRYKRSGAKLAEQPEMESLCYATREDCD